MAAGGDASVSSISTPMRLPCVPSWWSQHWLLDGRVSWRALRAGAISVGIATTILVRLSRVIMPGQISWQVHAYGLIGGVFVLSVWLMILSAVIFGGVLLGALIVQRRATAEQADPQTTDTSPLTLAGLDSSAAGRATATAADESMSAEPIH